MSPSLTAPRQAARHTQPRATSRSVRPKRAQLSVLLSAVLLLSVTTPTLAHPGHFDAPVFTAPIVDCGCLVGPPSPSTVPSCLPQCCFACNADPVPTGCLSALAEAACAPPVEPSPDVDFELGSMSPQPEPIISPEPFASPDALTEPDPLPAMDTPPDATVVGNRDRDGDRDDKDSKAAVTDASTTTSSPTTTLTTEATTTARATTTTVEQTTTDVGPATTDNRFRPNAPDACACLLAEDKCRDPLATTSGSCDARRKSADQPIFCKWTCCVLCTANPDAPPCPMQRFKGMCASVRALVRQYPHLIENPGRW